VVLIDPEEKLFVDWMLKVANLSNLLSIGELKAKVFELTQACHTAFSDGILGSGDDLKGS
jgi:hypothetical protein